MSTAWETFLPIPKSNLVDEAPIADAMFLTSRGIEPEAPAVISLLREQVLPLIRHMENTNALFWYSFLVHDRNSGVPTTSDDNRVFIHLRVEVGDGWDFDKYLAERFASWVMTRRCELSTDIAGVECDKLLGGSHSAWSLIGAQSSWLLVLIETHKDAKDVYVMIKHLRQFLHFFANMAQMRVA